MSPVHVVVGTDPRAEAMWADAFAGAIDLYRFDRNVDAFERLTAAQAPIDLVVLTPAQDGLFNLTPDQFVARVLEGPLATSPMLANLHIIVVGAQLARQHPRAVSVRTLDAAIRLVKFGEIELPRSRPAAPAPAAAVRTDAPVMPTSGSFSDNVISRIWAAADSAPASDPVAPRGDVVGGGPAQAPAPAGAKRLFAAIGQSTASDVVAPSADSQRAASTVMGGGPVNALAQAISDELQAQREPAGPMLDGPVAQAQALQPSQPYVLPNGGAYRGPEMRRNQIPPASSYNSPTAKRPVPPAIASQIHTMVYAQGAHAPADPVLSWSSARPTNVAPVTTVTVPVPVPVAAPGAHAPAVNAAPVATPIRTQPIAPPMQPPAGAYGTPAPVAAPVATPVDAPVAAIQADPFVQRAVNDGGVTFG